MRSSLAARLARAAQLAALWRRVLRARAIFDANPSDDAQRAAYQAARWAWEAAS